MKLASLSSWRAQILRSAYARVFALFLFMTASLAYVALRATAAQSGRKTPQTSAEKSPREGSKAQTKPSPSDAKPATENANDASVVAAPVSKDEEPPSSAPATPSPQNAKRNQTGSAQNPSAGEESGEDEVVRVVSTLVPIPATVLDAQGRAVVDLKAEDFELKVDGELKSVGDVTRSETPVALTLLFDKSSSLNSARRFEVKAAATFFKRVMRPGDRAAVYAISTDPELALPLTNDVRALVRAVESFGKREKTKNATALFDTLIEASLYLKPHRARKVIVIVSDGVDTTSARDFDETLKRLLSSDCQVYAVKIGHSDNPNLYDLAAERRLQEFASSTGGAVFAPRNTQELEAAFKQIAADLAQQYILSYYPKDETRDGRFRKITLSVAARPTLRVRTRKGFYAQRKADSF